VLFLLNTSNKKNLSFFLNFFHAFLRFSIAFFYFNIGNLLNFSFIFIIKNEGEIDNLTNK
jgi:hypothetical protein